MGHFSPSYVRHAAHFGFDCIWLDLEHRLIDEREVQALLAFCHLYDIDCLLRPPTLEKTRLYRYLEDGATGLMIPHVSTPEKAMMLVDAVKFPPLGDRGLDAAGLDSDFWIHGDADYVEHANRETFLVVQIETPEAIANVGAIAAVPGVDGLFIGPGDLSLRLKHTGGGLTLEDAFAHVAAAAAEHGKAWGSPVSANDMRRRRDQGAQLLAHGGDFMALVQMLERSAADFDEALL
ncbi:MAG TPA: aldolase/citrate lyase family protein [Pararhizobium sp.]|nr:aldolase/citrate lyase family protein [Pararhizobium sp.]